MRKTKHALFAFSSYTYKAMEAYLNRQAARGWALERIGRCEELAPIDFSWADEAWMGNWIDTGLFEGEGQVLIARRGLVILYLFAPMELTGNDVLRAFREQLKG